jgi:hypothetical protein
MLARLCTLVRIIHPAPLAFLLFVSIGPVAAHEGEQHSGPTVPTTKNEALLSIAGSGETFELTITYPLFKTGQKVPLRIFLANLETNKPISNATLSLTLTGSGAEVPIAPTPTNRPGEYHADIQLRSNSSYSFLVEVSVGDSADFFSIDGLKPPTVQPARAESSHSSFNVNDYLTYIAVGAFMVVALISYYLGARERASRTSDIQKDIRQETP